MGHRANARRSRRLVGTVLVAAACGAAAGCTSSSQPTPSNTTLVTQTPVAPPTNVTVCITPAVTCTASEMKTEPTSIVLSGDGSTFVRHLTWTGWGESAAQGTGTLESDNCKPSCAKGSLNAYQATISLSDLTSYGNGKHAYADMLVNAPAAAYASNDYQNLVP